MSAESNLRWSERVSSYRIALAMVFGRATPCGAGENFQSGAISWLGRASPKIAANLTA